jgi:hypothetical protein
VMLLVSVFTKWKETSVYFCGYLGRVTSTSDPALQHTNRVVICSRKCWKNKQTTLY